ncbi:peptidylprolyl isomerase [Sporosarcina sp. PTS2304]|uniref:peptidylprolyl isomerase n=1 Tax=Sporosarcina sp. PTS2304 TaxID=2283194 RepID=UPI000E0DE3EA|nr:peptidylprolyl isomerase [Sporosarcina sp. PTS2304]AXI00641.1 peptidylprolyl isomerase [Sporosarcina sp. PTS2304]
MLKHKTLSLLLFLVALTLILASCGTKTEEPEETTEQPVDNSNYSKEVKENPIVTITMENDEQIVMELEPAVAPNTVANFVSLVEEGYYDGLIFHRVIPDFMIQGGDSAGNGSGGPGYSIDGEFTSNGFENNLLHERGVVSMARTGEPNSAGSQFFIMTADTAQLDGDYAAFGKVIEGMETVDAIVVAERDPMDKPLEDQKMKKVEVDTKGFDYPAPVVND